MATFTEDLRTFVREFFLVLIIHYIYIALFFYIEYYLVAIHFLRKLDILHIFICIHVDIHSFIYSYVIIYIYYIYIYVCMYTFISKFIITKQFQGNSSLCTQSGNSSTLQWINYTWIFQCFK